MSLKLNVNGNFVQKAGLAIPFKSDALFWLDGTISGNEFIDKSGNGRNFAITNNDIGTSKGFKYKSAATISAPVGDAVLIAADINNFLYDSGGTPNEISVISLFQNIDYEDKLFTRHKDISVNAVGVETYEPRVLDIVLYDNVKVGDELTKCNSYFEVPAKVTPFREVGAGKAYATIVAAASFAPAGTTVYIYSGTYKENGAQSSLYMPGNVTLIGVGYVTVQSASATRVVFADKGSNYQEYKGLIIDGEGLTGTGIEFNSGATGQKVDRCKIINTTSQDIVTESSGDNTEIFNSILTGLVNQLNLNGTSDVRGNLFVGSCDRSIIHLSDSTLDVFNNKFNVNNTNEVIYLSTGTRNVNVKGNTAIGLGGGAWLGRANLANVVVALNCSYNNISGHYTNTPIRIEGLAVFDNLIVDNNTFNLNASTIGGAIYIENQVAPIITNNIINKLGTQLVDLIRVHSTGKQCDGYLISNNVLSSDYQTGHGIIIGNEGSGAWTGKLENGTISKNKIYGAFYNSGNLTPNNHEIMINDQQNFVIEYNFVRGGGIGFITKGDISVTEGIVKYNIFENCHKPIFINGIRGVKIYNNTIVNLGKSFAQAINIIENAGGTAESTIIKNTIIITIGGAFITIDNVSLPNFETNYALFKHTGGNEKIQFRIEGVDKTFSEWEALNYDLNSHLLTDNEYNNLFIDKINADYGINIMPYNALDLGNSYKTGLSNETVWGGENILPDVVNKDQIDQWDIGAYIN